MITYPIAKINLGLNVVAKRADGYHDLQILNNPHLSMVAKGRSKNDVCSVLSSFKSVAEVVSSPRIVKSTSWFIKSSS